MRIEGTGCRALRAVLRSLGFLPGGVGSHQDGLSRGVLMTMTALAKWRADCRRQCKNTGMTALSCRDDGGWDCVMSWRWRAVGRFQTSWRGR